MSKEFGESNRDVRRCIRLECGVWRHCNAVTSYAWDQIPIWAAVEAGGLLVRFNSDATPKDLDRLKAETNLAGQIVYETDYPGAQWRRIDFEYLADINGWREWTYN